MSDPNPLFHGEEEAASKLDFRSPAPEMLVTKSSPSMVANIFADASNPVELIGQIMGFASMCWENVSGAGEFQATKAQKGMEHAVNRLAQLSDQCESGEERQ